MSMEFKMKLDLFDKICFILFLMVLVFSIGFLFGHFYNYHIVPIPEYYGYFTENLTSITTNNNTLKIEADREIYSAQARGTGSMFPLMKRGSIIIYIKPKKDEIRIGDILIYWNWDEQIVHRVINITDEGYILKGDNVLKADVGYVKFENVVGKVIGVIW